MITILFLVAVVIGVSTLRQAPTAGYSAGLTSSPRAQVDVRLADLDSVRSYVEANARRPGVNTVDPGAGLIVEFDGEFGEQPLAIAVIDAHNGSVRARRTLTGGDQGPLRFDGLPAGEHLVLLQEADDDTRFGALRSEAVTIEEAQQGNAVLLRMDLDLHQLDLVLVNQREALPTDGPEAAVTARVLSLDDPRRKGPLASRHWKRSVGEKGEIQLGPLGPGRYQLELIGFEANDPTQLSFEIPRPEPLVIEGSAR